MSFIWPAALLGLLCVPVLALLYVWALKRRRRYTIRYSSIGLVQAAATDSGRIRRHVPAVLYLAALAALSIGMARPYGTVLDPEATGTVILAIDASRSMLSVDVAPSRIDAAKVAVRSFAEKQPDGIKIGVVAFAGSAALITPPTFDRKAVIASVNTLYLGQGTNIGDGLLASLEAIIPGYFTDPEFPPATGAARTDRPAADNPNSAVVVLLSDGASTTGPQPLEAAQALADEGIRIYTVGLGTNQGVFSGRGRFRELDEVTLKGIAEETGGEYFNATSASQLSAVYGKLARHHDLVEKRMEVTVIAAAAGMLLMLAGGFLGALWFNRLP